MIDAYRQGVPVTASFFPTVRDRQDRVGFGKGSELPYFVMVPISENAFVHRKRYQKDSRIRTDGRTRSLPMTPLPTRSS